MRTLLVALWVLGLGCVSHVSITPEQRGSLERTLTDKHRNQHLRLSFYVTPFFGDGSKRLLTAAPPEEVHLLSHPNGQPVHPGGVERILPAGTRARITRVEFPTAWVIAERMLYTPRQHPWIYLAVEGQPSDVPLILVLRSHLNDEQEFLAELERFLTEDDPSLRMSEWSEAVRLAIAQKVAMVDMSSEALEMAWGYPERKQVTYENGIRLEDWLYPGRKRIAHLADGRVLRLTVPDPAR